MLQQADEGSLSQPPAPTESLGFMNEGQSEATESIKNDKETPMEIAERRDDACSDGARSDLVPPTAGVQTIFYMEVTSSPNRFKAAIRVGLVKAIIGETLGLDLPLIQPIRLAFIQTCCSTDISATAMVFLQHLQAFYAFDMQN